MGLVHPSQTSPKDSFATRGILDPAGDALHSSYGLELGHEAHELDARDAVVGVLVLGAVADAAEGLGIAERRASTVLAHDLDAAARRAHQPDEDAHERGLAGSVRTEQARGAGRQLERYVAQGDRAIVEARDAREARDECAHEPPPRSPPARPKTSTRRRKKA